MANEYAIDILRTRTGSTSLSHLPTESLVYQAKTRLGPNTDPMILELVERMDEAVDHVEDLYQEEDEVVDKVNELMAEIKHLPELDDPTTDWACRRDDAQHNDIEDMLDLAKEYIQELTGFIQRGHDT